MLREHKRLCFLLQQTSFYRINIQFSGKRHQLKKWTPVTAGLQATARTPTTARMPATSGAKATAGTPKAPGMPQ
jgi:hypothetical protein